MMQTLPRRKLLLLPLILAWILFVLGGYYYFHKPISLVILLSPLQAVLDILFSLVFAGIAGGLGRRLLRSRELPAVESAVAQFALGAAAVSLIWYLLGLMGLFRFPLAWPLLLIGVALLWREGRAWYQSVLGEMSGAFRRSSGIERALAVLAVIFVLYQLVATLAPPLKWDALTYHLQLPRLYLDAGRLAFTPENPYWGHPQLVEMLYTLAISFHRAETAGVLGWTAGVVFLIGIFSFTNHQMALLKGGEDESPEVPTTAGWMAVTALLAGLSFRQQFAWSYCDLFSALYGLSALIAFFYWMDHPRLVSWYFLAGLLSGLAAGTKWTSGILAVTLFLFAFAIRKSEGLSIKNWFIGGLTAFAATTPWLVKNWVVTGNPVYPYFFNTTWIDSTRSALFNGPPEGVAWWMAFFAPITSTWVGIEGAIGFGADIGPLLLLFAVPGFWLYRNHAKVKFMLLAVLLLMVSLMFLGPRIGYLQQTRLYYVLLPCMAIPAGWGWDWLQQQNIAGVRFRRLMGTMVILVMALALWQDTHWLSSNTAFQVLMGTKSRAAYLESNLGYYSQAMEGINNLPADSKVLMLWEPRGFYAPVSSQPDLWIDRWITDYRAMGEKESVLAHWKAQGFTHLLVYHLGEQFVQPKPGEEPTAAWTAYKEMVGQFTESVSYGDWYTVYSLP